MKKSIKITLMLILLIAVMVIPTLISASTESKILKKSDKYLIYNENVMNEEFTFAFGEKENQEDLIYFPSAKDTSEEGAKNVAYIDDEIKSKMDAKTKAYLEKNSEAFLFMKNKNGEDIIKAEKIELKNAIDNEKIENTTKRIKVDTTQTDITTQTIEGVKTEVTKGKVVITDNAKAKYSYILVKLPTEGENEYTKLMDLATNISNKEEIEKLDIIKKLELMESFSKLYDEKAPKAEDKAWLEVENLEIKQPQDSKNGEKYIVFIKSESGKDVTIDAQFLTCTQKEEKSSETQTIKVKETSKLPVTFDSTTTLIIVLAVIIVLIIIVLIVRKKASKKDENK